MTDVQSLREQLQALEVERDEWIDTANRQTELFVAACQELARLSSISPDGWMLKLKGEPDKERQALERRIEDLANEVAKARLESEDLRGQLESQRKLAINLAERIKNKGRRP